MSGWHVGVAKEEITPPDGHWLDGWGARNSASTAVTHKIYAKALALRWHDDAMAVIVTTDLLGFSPTLTESLVEWVEREFSLPRSNLILNASHNHSGPVVDDVLPLYFNLSAEHNARVSAYTADLEQKLQAVIRNAIAKLAPATIGRACALAGFAVNRRRFWPGFRGLPQAVDHDVPVLSARAAAGEGESEGRLLAVMFGYSCHATCTDDMTVHGDFPGHAQAAIEAAHAGTVALFLNGCGADQGPVPRFRPGLGETYGGVLAAAVEDALFERELPNGDLSGGTSAVDGPLRCAFGTASLPLEPPKSRAEYVAMRDADKPAHQRHDEQAASTTLQRSVDFQLARLDSGRALPVALDYKVQVWRFGFRGAALPPLTLVALTGECVVDYALRLKRELGCESTWVSSYNNELLAYVPSARVREEGGMEGGEAMLEYRHPSRFGAAVERNIVAKVHELHDGLTAGGDDAAGSSKKQRMG